MRARRQIAALLLVTPGLLSIPLIAGQMTDEVDWSIFDFAIAAALILGAGAALLILNQWVKPLPLRLAATGFVILIVLAIWIELAVGWID